ncbi:MAG TPA: CHASE2 domain-containing protein, partial [Longimicrobiales bacterium]
MKLSSSASAFLRRLRRRLPLALGIGAAVGVLVWLLSSAGVLDKPEGDAFDARAKRLANPAEADTSIVIVAIDDNSLEALRRELGRWPWPREAYAGIVNYLSQAGARLIIFDLTFPEPDIYRPLGDTMFAEAIAASQRVVLPMTMQLGDSAQATTEEARYGLTERRQLLERFAIGFPDAAPGLENHPFVGAPDPTF